MKDLSLNIHSVYHNTHTVALQSNANSTITQEIPLPERLHQLTSQLLESMRGSTKNVIHPGLPVNEATLERDIIDQLYESAFQNPIGEAIQKQLQNDDITLLIHSPDPKVRNLPWEMLTERLGGFGTGQKPRLSIVRTICATWDEFNATETMPPTATPLKLLFVTALPENISERGKELQIEDEQRKLIEAIGDLEATGTRQPKMVVEFLDVASLEEITTALKARRHDILHVSGHGKFNESVKQSVLHLENEDGDHLETEGRVFAEALRGFECLRLVVLSACETAVVDAESCTVEAVAAVGVPAVVGMRFSVGDVTAKVFTTHFYRELAEGATVAGALAFARNELWEREQEWKRLHRDQYRLPEYFIPVLYCNGAVQALVDSGLPYQFPSDFYPVEVDGKRRIGAGFIGRKRQLIQMRKAFREGRHVCIAGMGGMGKTTLAEAFAGNYENGTHHVIIWRGGTEINEFGILNRIVLEHGRRHQGAELKTLRAVIENGEMPVLNRLHYVIQKCLVGERTILVFDNFEDLQDLSGGDGSRGIVSEGLREFLGYLLAHAPAGCHLLFTTRYRIEGLSSLVETIDLDKLSPAEQYRWMNYSPILREMLPDERKQAYARLDGLPRAYEYLEVLASQESFSWVELDNALEGAVGSVLEDLMMDRIYEFLKSDSQRMLLITSTFKTKTNLAILAGIIPCIHTDDNHIIDSDSALKELVGWKLCYLDEELREFEVHEIIRRWVGLKNLVSKIEYEIYAILIGVQFEKAGGVSNLEKALLYYEMGEDFDSSVSIARQIIEHSRIVGNYPQIWDLCKKIQDTTTNEMSLGVAFYSMGEVLVEWGEYQESIICFQKSFTHFKSYYAYEEAANSLASIAQSYYLMNDWHSALDSIDQCIDGINEEEYWEGQARALNTLGQMLNDHGEFEKALEVLNQSLDVAQRECKRGLEANIRNNIAVVAVTIGELDLGSFHLSQAALIAEEMGNLQNAAVVLHNLASVSEKKLELEEALKYYERSIEFAQEINDINGLAHSLNNMGVIEKNRGQQTIAISYFHQSIFMFCSIKSTDAMTPMWHLKSMRHQVGEARFQEILTTLDLVNSPFLDLENL